MQSDLCNAKSTVNKPHAVMSAGSAIFCYDANGNMTQKIAGSTTSYTYDAENRMTAVSGASTMAECASSLRSMDTIGASE